MAIDRELSPYEINLCAAMAARRDAAHRLKAALEHDIGGYEENVVGVQDGRAMEILVPPLLGTIRKEMSDLLSEFEADRHQFRLALVAVGMDNGMSAREIAESFSFSRQLASRYVKEAREMWPDLEHQRPVLPPAV
ncbi:MAG: hypothetical protein WCI26_11325 [Acidimicrobiales bacterium]